LTTSERRRPAKRAVAAVLAVVALAGAPAARAQTADQLKAARELFQEAYKDEQEKRFDAALEKFQRVARVKESAAVRYRIASVLDALGRLREARDAFRALAASKPSLPAAEQEIADSAAERALALDKRIPRLVLRLDAKWPADARMTVDGAPVPASSTSSRIVEVDPGDHVVAVSSSTTRTVETRVAVADGGEVSHTIAVPEEHRAAVPPAAVSPAPSEEPRANGAPDRTLGYVALGAGGALVVTSAILLAVRSGDIDDLRAACPGDVCPGARRAELESTHDRAELFGPLALGAGLAGLAALGVGGYLVLRPGAAAPTSSAPHTSVVFGPRAVRGGGMVALGATF